MSDITSKLKQGQNLSFDDSKSLFLDLMEGKHAEDKIIEILEALIKKGETKDELAGGIYILRDKATKVSSDPKSIKQDEVKFEFTEEQLEALNKLWST